MNTQITEDYCSFEVAKLLKEKGFNELTCGFYYDKFIGKLIVSSPNNYNDSITSIAAPSQAHAMKWLREVHNNNIVLDMIPEGDDCYVLWTFNILSNKNYKIMWGNKQPKYNTYEEACEAAIKYCLTNLI